MTTWLTADWHVWHQNILHLVGRPFTSCQKMHEAMITNYQECVRDEDTVYFLGDLTLRGPNRIDGIRKIVGMLPGQKHFILGNHDRLKVGSYLRMGFVSVHTHLDIQRGGVTYHLVHNPAEALSGAQRIVCGHVHEKWKTRTEPVSTVNIGVDQWEFCPVRFSDAVRIGATTTRSR